MTGSGDWLATNGFHCVALRAAMSRRQCVARQRRPRVVEARWGAMVTLRDSPQDLYCSSGECRQGRAILVELHASGAAVVEKCVVCGKRRRRAGKKRCGKCLADGRRWMAASRARRMG